MSEKISLDSSDWIRLLQDFLKLLLYIYTMLLYSILYVK